MRHRFRAGDRPRVQRLRDSRLCSSHYSQIFGISRPGRFLGIVGFVLQNVGMHIARESVHYSKVLREGIDLSTQSV